MLIPVHPYVRLSRQEPTAEQVDAFRTYAAALTLVGFAIDPEETALTDHIACEAEDSLREAIGRVRIAFPIDGALVWFQEVEGRRSELRIALAYSLLSRRPKFWRYP